MRVWEGVSSELLSAEQEPSAFSSTLAAYKAVDRLVPDRCHSTSYMES